MYFCVTLIRNIETCIFQKPPVDTWLRHVHRSIRFSIRKYEPRRYVRKFTKMFTLEIFHAANFPLDINSHAKLLAEILAWCSTGNYRKRIYLIVIFRFFFFITRYKTHVSQMGRSTKSYLSFSRINIHDLFTFKLINLRMKQQMISVRRNNFFFFFLSTNETKIFQSIRFRRKRILTSSRQRRDMCYIN